jgi:hypothetical protein
MEQQSLGYPPSEGFFEVINFIYISSQTAKIGSDILLPCIKLKFETAFQFIIHCLYFISLSIFTIILIKKFIAHTEFALYQTFTKIQSIPFFYKFCQFYLEIFYTSYLHSFHLWCFYGNTFDTFKFLNNVFVCDLFSWILWKNYPKCTQS